MNSLKHFLSVGAALTLLALVLAYLAGLFHPKIDPDADTARVAEVAGQIRSVEVVNETLFEEAIGTVQAKDETVISARIIATIAKVNVRAGDRIEVGDRLVELDAREAAAQFEQQQQGVVSAQARLVQARKEYDRTRNIFKSAPEAISQTAIESAEASLRAAEAEIRRARGAVEEAQTTSSYASINSPINGTVVERYADPGDTATPGLPLLRIYNPRLLRLEASVRESLVRKLSAGADLTVHIDALDSDLPATVEEIVPSADPGSRSFLVRLTLPDNEFLYPGMFGRLRIPSSEVERYYVPAGAVNRMGQLEFVLAKTERGAVRRYVRTGVSRANGQIEILSGLEPGEQVVVNE